MHLQLLVSVRDGAEAMAALAGGADIIDAKEPARGPLGPVSAEQLWSIDERVPEDVSLSVALGDFASGVAAAAAIAAVQLRRRAAPIYVKLGLPPVGSADLRGILAPAAEAAARHPAGLRLIAVEYADRSASVGASKEFCFVVSNAGGHGLLVDTASKDGRTLLDRWPEPRLSGWIRGTRTAGLLAAVAGSLGLPELTRVAGLRPDVIGVRGAACSGGRSGTVQAARVGELRLVLEHRDAANRKTPQLPLPPASILK